MVRKPKYVEQKKANVEQKKAHDLLEMIQGLRQLIDRLEAELFDVYKKVKNSKSFFSLQSICTDRGSLLRATRNVSNHSH